MGTGKTNIYPNPHGQHNWGTEYKFRVHHEDDELDTTSPLIDQDDYEDLQSACGTYP